MQGIPLAKLEKKTDYGGKINGLIDLYQMGLLVPETLVLPEESLTNLWLPLVPEAETNQIMTISYQEILTRLETLVFPKELIEELSSFISNNQTYIVRSSGMVEDLAAASFAGQFDSIGDCHSLEDILQGIKQCLASLFKPNVLAYCLENGISNQQLRMSVIIQKQIQAKTSGIAFSMNPLTNEDEQMVVELVEGAGEKLASGKVTPEQLTINWFDKGATSKKISQEQLAELQEKLVMISATYGFPIDVEFCFDEDKLYFLQVRPITRINRKIAEGNWTTANFRDGGVAAQPCPALMWSLYRSSWQDALEKFLLEHRLYSGKVPPLAIYHFARPYWNIGMVKEAMSQIPSYIEREFDDELGVYKNYQGNGFETKLTPQTISHLVNVGWRITKTTNLQRKTADEQHQHLLELYQILDSEIKQVDEANIERLWTKVVNEAYMQSETSYFWQVFVNTVQLSMKKTALLKKLPLATFFQLIAKLGDVSHVQPLKEMLEIVSSIQATEDIASEWQNLSTDELEEILSENPKRMDTLKIRLFQDKFGYHSTRELNLLVPNYSEDIRLVIELIQDYLVHPEKLASAIAAFSEVLTDKEIQDLLAPHISKWQQKKVFKDIKMLRELLWWREEFKDISTRYYHLVRQISLKLGQKYQTLGYLEHQEDIFYLEKETIQTFMTQKLTANELAEKAKENQLYCQSYRDFVPPGDLSAVASIDNTLEKIDSYTGIGANDGIATGNVRILFDPKEIDQLQSGEILVTRFTDTGWSHAFSSIAGLITETGGVLCHASIVAREFGIPTVVCADGATNYLETGMLVSVDGTTGEIRVHE